MPEQEKLVDEIGRSGFLLEWRTASVFESFGFSTEQNVLLQSAFPANDFLNRLIEIDVFAREVRAERPGDGYVVECKGANSTDKLVLVPTPKNLVSLPSVYFEPDGVVLRENENVLCDNNSQNLPGHCHTGDFFLQREKNGEKIFSKSSTQDERNNLYRGVIQLHSALDAVFAGYRSAPFRVFPVIVTNAEIHIARFDLSKKPSRISTRMVPWSAYQNPMTYTPEQSLIGAKEWRYGKGRGADPFGSQRRIPAIWIVNIEYLEAFIRSGGKGRQYPPEFKL